MDTEMSILLYSETLFLPSIFKSFIVGGGKHQVAAIICSMAKQQVFYKAGTDAIGHICFHFRGPHGAPLHCLWDGTLPYYSQQPIWFM